MPERTGQGRAQACWKRENMLKAIYPAITFESQASAYQVNLKMGSRRDDMIGILGVAVALLVV